MVQLPPILHFLTPQRPLPILDYHAHAAAEQRVAVFAVVHGVAAGELKYDELVAQHHAALSQSVSKHPHWILYIISSTNSSRLLKGSPQFRCDRSLTRERAVGNRIFSAGNTHNLHDAVATSWQQESKMYPQVNYKEEKRFVSSVQPDTAASTGGGEQYD